MEDQSSSSSTMEDQSSSSSTNPGTGAAIFQNSPVPSLPSPETESDRTEPPIDRGNMDLGFPLIVTWHLSADVAESSDNSHDYGLTKSQHNLSILNRVFISWARDSIGPLRYSLSPVIPHYQSLNLPSK
ncbi:hypothetical protein Fot_15652 [Forsythia ovata]|uniref:Uncharacterized protein n=1 Tax=Forsythia ovata TaxID=205694 RepID=A0ABD1NWV1_9LAMI